MSPEPHAEPIAERIARLLPHAGPADADVRLLLFAIRRVAVGGLNDAHAASRLIMRFGRSFRRPLVLLRALMAELSRASRRTLALAPCCCPRMTRDESLLLAIVSGALADARGTHARLTRLLGVPDCLGALTSAQALAAAFADLGCPLDRVPAAQADQ